MLIPISQAFPVGVYAFHDSTIQLVPLQSILNGAVIDQNDGVSGVFDREGFSLQKGIDDALNFEYNVNYPYKDMPILLEWLKQQNMMLPN